MSRGWVHALLAQIVVALCALAGVRLLTQSLTPERFGGVMMVSGALALGEGLVVMAFSQTLYALLPRLPDPDTRRRATAGLAARLILVVAAAGAAAVAVAAGLIGLTWAGAAGLVAAYLCGEVAKTGMTACLQFDGRSARHSAWLAAEAVASLVGAVAGVRLGGGALGYLLGLLLARTLTSAVFRALSFPGRLFVPADWEAARRYVRPALRHGGPASLMAPLGWLSAYLDRYAVAAAVGLGPAGAYAAAFGIMGRPYTVASAALTQHFRAPLAGPHAAAARAERLWLAAAAAVGALGVLGSLVLGPLVARILLAEPYRPAASLLLPLAAMSQSFVILTHALDNAMLAAGEGARLLRWQGALVLVPAALIPLGAAAGGLPGAALGRIASDALRLAAIYHASRRRLAARALTPPAPA